MTYVLISRGFVAGWSTWADDNLRQDALFDQPLIDAVLKGEVHDERSPAVVDFLERLRAKHGPNTYFYAGGASGLTAVELEPGTRFRVTEYDGRESIETMDNITWMVA